MARRPKPSRPSEPQPDLFIAHAEVATVPTRRVRWSSAHRLIPSRYPPIDLFERIAPPSDWEALAALEGLTNPRLRQDAGQISHVPIERRVSGPGASIVMAPFTHCSTSKPTRFSDGTFGVYYAAQQFETALREVVFHMARFHDSTSDPATVSDYREYAGRLDATLHDLMKGERPEMLSPDIGSTYPSAQRLARMLRESGSNGVVYPSQRHKGGQCIAAFWPDVVAIPLQRSHITLKWDGAQMVEWFDYATGKRTKL